MWEDATEKCPFVSTSNRYFLCFCLSTEPVGSRNKYFVYLPLTSTESPTDSLIDINPGIGRSTINLLHAMLVHVMALAKGTTVGY